MNTKKILAPFILSLSAMSGVAAADSSYFGGGVAIVDFDSAISADLVAAYGRAGTKFSENFSGEVRLGVGVADDTATVFGGDIDVSLENFAGAYLRAGLPVSGNIYPYVIAGVSRVDMEVSSAFASASDSETDLSYGLGSDFMINDSVGVNVEYMSYIDKNGGEITALGATLFKQF